METNAIFAGMPVLSLITNFTPDGQFERIHLVTGRPVSSKHVRNQMRRNLPVADEAQTAWNGPALRLPLPS